MLLLATLPAITFASVSRIILHNNTWPRKLEPRMTDIKCQDLS